MPCFIAEMLINIRWALGHHEECIIVHCTIESGLQYSVVLIIRSSLSLVTVHFIWVFYLFNALYWFFIYLMLYIGFFSICRHLEALCKVIAESFELAQGVKVDPDHVTLCCGQSEAFAASILAGLFP